MALQIPIPSAGGGGGGGGAANANYPLGTASGLGPFGTRYSGPCLSSNSFETDVQVPLKDNGSGGNIQSVSVRNTSVLGAGAVVNINIHINGISVLGPITYTDADAAGTIKTVVGPIAYVDGDLVSVEYASANGNAPGSRFTTNALVEVT